MKSRVVYRQRTVRAPIGDELVLYTCTLNMTCRSIRRARRDNRYQNQRLIFSLGVPGLPPTSALHRSRTLAQQEVGAIVP